MKKKIEIEIPEGKVAEWKVITLLNHSVLMSRHLTRHDFSEF